METKKMRFTALDIFRGMTICFMIIVNTPGSGATPYWPLNHALWHGFTPTDLVFPSFLFAVGNALSFSDRKFNTLSESQVLFQLFKRSFIIFLLGYLMYWFPFFKLDAAGHVQPFPFHDTRVFGVLQRIGLCYFFGALIVRYLSRKIAIIACGLILLLYWGILVYFGIGDPFSLEGNAIFKLDVWLLGESHLYHDHGIIFDPEGLLSTLPAIVNVVAGYFSGKYIQEHLQNKGKIAKLFYVGFFCIILALCWNIAFPINKKIWSSSFVLITIGLDLLILPLLVLTTSQLNEKDSAFVRFFTIFGKNPLPIYLLSELLLIVLYMIPIGSGSNFFDWMNLKGIQQLIPGPNGSLLFALVYMLICWSAGWILDKKKIYIKV